MKLTHVRLLVDDYPGCFRFYRDVMGFPVTFGDEEGGYADFDAGSDVSVALFIRRYQPTTSARPGRRPATGSPSSSNCRASTRLSTTCAVAAHGYRRSPPTVRTGASASATSATRMAI
jgi:catechol 2,3-dioxygenase-like lactoylglutathione lyase family enzyme